MGEGTSLCRLEGQVLGYAAFGHAPVHEENAASSHSPLGPAPFAKPAIHLRAPLGDAAVASEMIL